MGLEKEGKEQNVSSLINSVHIALDTYDDIFSYFDFSKRSDQTKFGNKINKFVGRVLSDIKMIVKDNSIRSSRQEYIFTKEKVDIDKSKIFGDFHNKDGNVGNLHNLSTIGSNKSNNFNETDNRLPTLRTLPKNEDDSTKQKETEENTTQ